MKYSVLTDEMSVQYEAFLARMPNTLLYASNRYRLFLRDFLGCKDKYLIATNENNQICGVLPTFLKETPDGCVINSLPFYGSHGGVLHSGDRTIAVKLLESYASTAQDYKCLSGTIISSPFDEDLSLYRDPKFCDLLDERIGQFTFLPQNTDAKSLMDLFHSKTRNMIRKGQSFGFEVSADESKLSLDFLIQTHQENMAKIGGLAKPARFFHLIAKYFNYGTDYQIWTARYQGQIVAALLLFYYDKTVEYFTPVILESFRTQQPLSVLIYASMLEASQRGFSTWNWGGTWLTQDGVYNFKSRWGTVDKPYFYFTKVWAESVYFNTKDDLLTRFPYFYVVPFRSLKS